MPIPTPEKDESNNEYVDRCMGDQVMRSEYPDQAQRAAVCQHKWREHRKENKDA